MAVVENPIVKVENVSVSYGENAVLKNLNLGIYEGEFVSIIGKSGCGKSALLNAICGFIPYLGYVSRPPRIGVVFQEDSIFPWLTVAKNIGFGLEGMSKQERKKIVADYLHLIEMEEHAHKYPQQLSGGQKQRVGLAMALAPDPGFILMDEPLGSLDAYTRENMQNWLQNLFNGRNKTVLFITHDIREATYLSDRILVMHDGVIGKEYVVDFPRPRNEDLKFDDRFINLEKEILAYLKSH